MKKNLFVLLVLLSGVFISCSNDDSNGGQAGDFVAAFENPSTGFESDEISKDIIIVFSKVAATDGTITVSYSSDNAVYGEDFATMPQANSQTITVPIVEGTTHTSFEFKKLQNPPEGETATITFKITAVNHPGGYTQGNTETVVSLTESAALGGQQNPEVGGPNQPNQVYVDLSAQRETAVRRDSWDLGFYSGNDFRVIINGSIYMAVAQLDATDINTVNESQVAELMGVVAVGTFDPNNMQYIDSPDGNIQGTAIGEISSTEANNKVYLVNLGYEVGTETPEPGSVAIAGEHRGWKKIRILREGDLYTLQYADLNDTSHQSVSIPKTDGYNFTFFSFNTNSITAVEPAKEKWDLNFTVFTNEIEGYGSYGYADFVAANRKAGVTGYMVEGSENDYINFNMAQVNQNNFSTDQRFIGSDWRVGGGPGQSPYVKDNVFFVLKDANENYYKLRFLAMTNENGVRGYPSFEYKLLQ